jgi:nicotinamidase-related amidase
MLSREDSLFVLVDVQGKLAKMVHESDMLIANLKNLIQGLRIMGIPIVWLEQYPEGLGPTNEELAIHLTGLKPIRKISFNACKNPAFIEAIEKIERKQVLLAGIETHICVYQTALGMKSLGNEVQVVVDAVSSRTLLNKKIGLERMKDEGIAVTSVEMAIYELMQTADGEEFKQILQLLK